MLKLLTTDHHPLGRKTEPVFIIQDGKVFRTVYHPAGWSSLADYELKADGKIYRTPNHGLGRGDFPDYEFRGDKKLYRTKSHPDGPHELPEMEFMEKFRGDQEVTIIVVSQDLNLASMYADHIVLLKKGKVVKEGKPADVLTPEYLKQGYGCAMLVDQNHIGDRPRVNVVPDRLAKKS